MRTDKLFLTSLPARALRALGAWGAGIVLTACAAPVVHPWPGALKPTDGEQWLMELAAQGVQVYRCRPDADGRWTLVGAEADLFDRSGRRIGRHTAGTEWEAQDGSRVVGETIAHAEAPTFGSAPWVVSRTRNAGPEGAFSGVIRIRRVHTIGGIAPHDGCGQASAEVSVRVPYTADYVLYTARTAKPTVGVLS